MQRVQWLTPVTHCALSAVQWQHGATLESKLRADRRNAALQRQLDMSKQDTQLAARALLSCQVLLDLQLPTLRGRDILVPLRPLSNHASCLTV